MFLENLDSSFNINLEDNCSSQEIENTYFRHWFLPYSDKKLRAL